MARRKVQDMLITNNLKQIWNAAQLYFLENGTEEVRIKHLVWYTEPKGTLAGTTEEPYTNIIKCIRGEDYGNLTCLYTDSSSVATGDRPYLRDFLCGGLLLANNESIPANTVAADSGFIVSDATFISVPSKDGFDTSSWFTVNTVTWSVLRNVDIDEITGRVLYTFQEMSADWDTIYDNYNYDYYPDTVSGNKMAVEDYIAFAKKYLYSWANGVSIPSNFEEHWPYRLYSRLTALVYTVSNEFPGTPPGGYGSWQEFINTYSGRAGEILQDGDYPANADNVPTMLEDVHQLLKDLAPYL
jgi:hypothetical protein